MRINFNLKEPGAECSPIRLVVTNRGRVYRKQIGISIPPEKWRKPARGRQCSTDRDIEQVLTRIELSLRERIGDLSSPEEIEDAIEESVAGVKSGARRPGSAREVRTSPTFWEYFRDYSRVECPARRQRGCAYRLVKDLMGDGDDWDGIDSAWYKRLWQKMDGKGYSNNYKSCIITKVKTVMSEGLELKYHTNTEFRKFRKVTDEVDSVYLTEDELERLWSLPLALSMERKARDLFFLGVYTASRFSDYSRLTSDMMEGDELRFIQQKTGGSVIIPVSPKVREVLERNGDRAPKLSLVNYNKTIKEVCRKAGINSKVIVRRSRGRMHYQETLEKWQLVSSHTARRTGATLLYMSGVPMRQCMLITGHTSEANFLKYVRFTKEENARMLKDNPFFK